VWALAADTDGIDGVEDNAGAFVAPDTLAARAGAGDEVDAFLGRKRRVWVFLRAGSPGGDRARHAHQRE
jgi:hydroxypyruvate reductase